MKKVFLWVIICCSAPIIYAETIVNSISRADNSLVRYYHYTQENNHKTLLMMVQSGACISVFHQLDTRILLEKLGLQTDVLWVEKYGLTNESANSKCPQEYIENNSPLLRVDDYILVLNKLADQYDKIIVIGAQEGAAVVSLLLANETLPITAGIVINSGGGSYANDVLWQIEKFPMKVLDESHPITSEFLESTKNGDLPTKLAFQNHGYRWWYEMLNTNMYETLKKSQKPLLIVQGLADREILLDDSDTMYEQLTNKKNVTVYYYETLTHEYAANFRLPDIDHAIKDVRYWLEQLDQ